MITSKQIYSVERVKTKKLNEKKRHIAEVFNAPPPQYQQACFLMPEVTIFTSPNAVTLCWCEKGILGQPYSAPLLMFVFRYEKGCFVLMSDSSQDNMST
jgi:hypothetical protein